ncbi:MAG: hypothetical protein ACK5NB_06350 [Flavobacteriaceae bacterium]
MKKLFLLSILTVLSFTAVNAQDALSKGSWVIEANTGSATTGSTAFSLTSTDGDTSFNIGAEAGYFVKENLAIKVGLGYADASESFAYKVGAKYYINGQFPVGADFTGVSGDGSDDSFIGLQGGYAWFVAPNVSIEPTVRYNFTLNEDDAESGFQALIGFAFHF